MNMDSMSNKKKIIIISLFLIPLILSLFALFYLKFSWQISAQGEKFAPVQNKPLVVGIILFMIGYLFFLGMMFSDNLLELINKRVNLYKR